MLCEDHSKNIKTGGGRLRAPPEPERGGTKYSHANVRKKIDTALGALLFFFLTFCHDMTYVISSEQPQTQVSTENDVVAIYR